LRWRLVQRGGCYEDNDYLFPIVAKGFGNGWGSCDIYYGVAA
jgi:hypothetical protein